MNKKGKGFLRKQKKIGINTLPSTVAALLNPSSFVEQIFKGTLLTFLSHNIRNPVAIRNYKKKEESLERFLYLKKNQKKTNLPLPKSRCHPKLQKKRRIVRTILIFKKKIKKKLTCRCRNPVAIQNYKKKEESLERLELS